MVCDDPVWAGPANRYLCSMERTLRLRRLVWERRLWPLSRVERLDDEPHGGLERLGDPWRTPNLFERLFEPRKTDLLTLGLHARSLASLNEEDRLILDELLESPPDWGVEVLATSGNLTRARPEQPVPVVEIPEHIPAGVGRFSIRMGDETTGTTMFALADVPALAEHLFGDDTKTQDLIEVLTAHAAGADIVVTTDPELLARRDEGRLREVNLMSPAEAFALVGVWSRALGRPGSRKLGVGSNWLFYWALARSLTPAGWSAFSTWVHCARLLPNGADLRDLTSSVFSRLSLLARSLDQMVIQWERDESLDSEERLSDELDTVLLRVWAIQDNLARLAGFALGVTLSREYHWSLQDKEWQDKVRLCGPRGSALMELVRRLEPRIQLSRELRHHAVHRTSLQMLSFSTSEGSSPRMRLPERVLGELKRWLAEIGDTPDSWGIVDEYPRHPAKHTADHGGGLVEKWDEIEQGGAFLDPLPFAARLVAHVAELTNEVLKILDPSADPRIPAEYLSRISTPGPETWASPSGAAVARLASPVSGLTDWVTSPSAE
jgi:hypothetical protein